MARTEGRINGWSIVAEAEQIEVTSMLPEPDPNWEYIDAAGHLHTYAEPNLMEVLAEPYWCSDCREIHGDFVDHYECPECGAHIVPGTRPASGIRQFISGPVYVTATSPEGTSYPVTEEQLELITAEPHRIAEILGV